MHVPFDVVLVADVQQAHGVLVAKGRQLSGVDKVKHLLDGFRNEIFDEKSVLLVLRPVLGQQHGHQNVGLAGHDVLVTVEGFAFADDLEVRECRVAKEVAHVILKCHKKMFLFRSSVDLEHLKNLNHLNYD